MSHYGDLHADIILLLSNLVPEYVWSIRCSEPFAKCMIHIVKQQEVVTYMSPVEVFVNGITFFDRQILSMIALSFSSFAGVESRFPK